MALPRHYILNFKLFHELLKGHPDEGAKKTKKENGKNRREPGSYIRYASDDEYGEHRNRDTYRRQSAFPEVRRDRLTFRFSRQLEALNDMITDSMSMYYYRIETFANEDDQGASLMPKLFGYKA